MVKIHVLNRGCRGSRRKNPLGDIGRIFRGEVLGEDEGVRFFLFVAGDMAGVGTPSPWAAWLRQGRYYRCQAPGPAEKTYINNSLRDEAHHTFTDPRSSFLNTKASAVVASPRDCLEKSSMIVWIVVCFDYVITSKVHTYIPGS